MITSDQLSAAAKRLGVSASIIALARNMHRMSVDERLARVAAIVRQAKVRRRDLLPTLHPDAGGSAEAMVEVNDAVDTIVGWERHIHAMREAQQRRPRMQVSVTIVQFNDSGGFHTTTTTSSPWGGFHGG